MHFLGEGGGGEGLLCGTGEYFMGIVFNGARGQYSCRKQFHFLGLKRLSPS